MKLHLGCGAKNFGKDWLHVDAREFDHVDKRALYYGERFIWDLPGIEDGSVEMIYSAHMLQYFDWEEGEKLCGVWRRKLQPGGLLRLSVVDWDSLCELRACGSGLDQIIGPLFGKMKIGSMTRYTRCVYDRPSLETVLNKAGFSLSKIRRWTPDQMGGGPFADCSTVTRGSIPISLNLEAER